MARLGHKKERRKKSGVSVGAKKEIKNRLVVNFDESSRKYVVTVAQFLSSVLSSL
jgi:hypothetical protein